LTLIDANALVNLVDRNQPRSSEFRRTFNRMRRPAYTTLPAFTEAMYLLFGIGGWPLERRLWDFVLQDLVRFHLPKDAETRRTAELMERYRDRPMDFADASLVAAAESLADPSIFTQDADFRIYRYNDTLPFDVSP
jgi:uncharacterized protein